MWTTNKRRALGTWLLATGVVAGACSGPDEASESGVSVTDSAGVRIVEVDGLATLSVPEWRSEHVYSTAGGPEFTTIVDAAFLEDLALVVADQESSELVFLGPDGRALARAGRKGSGPGEYTEIGRLGVDVGGSPFVFDRRAQRLTVLDGSGNPTGLHRLDFDGRYLPYVPLTRLADGRYLAVLETRPVVPPGFHRSPLYLVEANEAGEVQDTLGRWHGKEFFATEDGNHWLPVGFARTALYAGRGAFTAVGTTDSLDITVFTGDSLALRLRGRSELVPIPAEERDAWVEHYLESWPAIARPTWRARIEQSAIRETYQAYGALAIDGDGRVWVGEYAGLMDDERVWTIFDISGRPIGRLMLPVYRHSSVEVENSIPGFRTHELLDVKGNRIAVLRVDALDVQYVEVLEIVGSS